MLLRFSNNTVLEKPAGAKLVGLKRGGHRPISVELDYYDFQQIVESGHKAAYFVHLWRALAPDARLDFQERYGKD